MQQTWPPSSPTRTTAHEMPHPDRSGALLEGLGLDWTLALLSTVFVGGLYLDGWAHNHGRVDDSFFTPWHGFFYGGFGLLALVLAVTLVRRYRHGLPLIPTGYRLTLAGMLIFAAGGLGDFVWHTLFGIEEDLEALFSPTHLALGVGLALVVSGPLRAAWARPGRRGNWYRLGPALLSTTLLLSAFTFFLMFAHPVTVMIGSRRHLYFSTDVGQMAGLLGLLVMAGLLVGHAYLLLVRWHLPPGGLTLVWGLNTAGMTWIIYEERTQFWLAGAMLAATVLVEGLAWILRPSPARPVALRTWGFAGPMVLYAAYWAALLSTDGTRWAIHLWAGSVVLGGLTGWLLSFLLIPPSIPTEVDG